MELTSFVGRRQETATAKRLLSAQRLLTLTGVAGVGKTRLAMRVANQVSHSYPDGAWLVPLAPLHDDALVVHAVADVLGIRDESARDPLAVLVEHLRDRKLLLVLDNCEHLLESCVTMARAILAGTTAVRMLVTSRHRLGLRGEQLQRIRPLPVPETGELARGAVDATAFPALRLFTDRASAAVHDFRITTENQENVARLCRRLDGLPLAIELAAVRTRVLSVEQIAERLDDRRSLLTSDGRTETPHHQTLRAAVAWSFDLCTPREQLVWALLSVFAGGFNLAAAQAVCAGDLDAADVADAVAGLVDKSVLISEHDGIPVRYRLLSSLRDRGLEKLGELDKTTTARRRHLDHYLRLAKEYESHWFGPRQAEIISHLGAEHDNLRAAFDFCLTTPEEAQCGLQLTGTLWFYWHCRTLVAEERHWSRVLAQRAGTRPAGARAKGLWVRPVMMLIHGRLAAMLLTGDQSDQDPPERMDPPPIPPLASCLDLRADLVSFAMLTRVELACGLAYRGQHELAVCLCTEALAVCEAHGEQWIRSCLLSILAVARWATGDYDSATSHARDCLRLDHTVLGPCGVSRTLDALAAIAAGQGAAGRAAVLLGASERIWPDTSRGPEDSQRWTGAVPVSAAQARSALGDSGFEHAFHRGGELSASDAVSYAMSDRTDVPAPRRSTPAGPVGSELTPRERQVAELVARGLTDQQIAGALVIARRTAESHVQHILVKLGFTNRTQVAAWFTAQQRADQPHRSS